MSADDGGLVLEFPDLEERLGEHTVNTAAHVLDRDLHQTGPVSDDLIPARLRGIDTPEELAAYRAVETRTRNRDRIHDLLDERAEYLKRHGFRPADLVVASLDQDSTLPQRFELRVPRWVSTDDLRERPEIRPGGAASPTGGRTRTPGTRPSRTTSRTTQATLAADGGEQS